MDVLKDAFTDGRLSRDEYDERLDRAYRSRTHQELALLTGDLPGPPPSAFRPLPPPRTNSYAVASLACGIAGTFLALPAVPAVVLGHMARRRIRETGEQGDGLAVGGLVLGYVVCAAMAAVLAVVIVVAVVVAS